MILRVAENTVTFFICNEFILRYSYNNWAYFTNFGCLKFQTLTNYKSTI